jgi:glycosyltransferase involved in cell wall biosynthesis
MSLKIVHVGKFYSPCPGGMETYLRMVAESQVAHGYDVTVVCMHHELRKPTSIENIGGVKVIRLSRLLSMAKLDFLPDLVATLRRLNVELRPSIWNVHVPNPTMILGVLRAHISQPIVVTYQSDNVEQKIRGKLFSLIENAFYQKVNRIFASSPAYIESSMTLNRFRKKVRVIPLGLELSPFEAPTESMSARAALLKARYGGPLWFTFGRMVAYKGFAYAIEALLYCTGNLLIAGDGPLKEDLKERAKALGVSSRVHFLGRLDDDSLIAYLHACDALWFPSISKNEAFGLVQVEAMAAGKPVINCHIEGSGSSWVSVGGITGVTVPPKDAKALGEAAAQLYANPVLMQKYSQQAKLRARDMFSAEVATGHLLLAYQEVLDDIHHMNSNG